MVRLHDLHSFPLPQRIERSLDRVLRYGRLHLRTGENFRNYFAEQYAYGHREVLLAAANLPASSHLAGGVQHGVWVGSGMEIPGLWDLWARQARYWIWSDQTVIGLTGRGASHAVAVGAPWLYLLQEKGMLSEPGVEGLERNECDFDYAIFPGHSSEWEFDVSPEAAAASRASAFRDFVGDASAIVCLYWLDFMDIRLRRRFEEAGFAVTCAGVGFHSGTPWSPAGGRVAFLKTLLGILVSARTFVGEEWGTAMSYAASLGMPISLLPTHSDGRTLSWGGRHLPVSCLNTQENYVAEALRVDYPEISEARGTPRLREWSLQTLGVQNMRSPRELREVLNYRVGVVPDLGELPF